MVWGSSVGAGSEKGLERRVGEGFRQRLDQAWRRFGKGLEKGWGRVEEGLGEGQRRVRAGFEKG